MTAHEVDEPAVVPAWKGTARFVFFVINFSLAILLFLSAIVAIAAAESFGSFCGGIMAIGPSGLYALGEWLAFYRNRKSIELPLGYANLGCAAFALVGVVKDIGVALLAEEPPSMEFLAGFAVIGLSITAYLLACGLFRLRCN